jgi:hypothetical protein
MELLEEGHGSAIGVQGERKADWDSIDWRDSGLKRDCRKGMGVFFLKLYLKRDFCTE